MKKTAILILAALALSAPAQNATNPLQLGAGYTQIFTNRTRINPFTITNPNPSPITIFAFDTAAAELQTIGFRTNEVPAIQHLRPGQPLATPSGIQVTNDARVIFADYIKANGTLVVGRRSGVRYGLAMIASGPCSITTNPP